MKKFNFPVFDDVQWPHPKQIAKCSAGKYNSTKKNLSRWKGRKKFTLN